VGKLKLSPLISPKRQVSGLEIFGAVGGLRALKNKNLASGPPVKGGSEKNNFRFQKISQKLVVRFLRNFQRFGGHPYDTLCKIWRGFDEGVLGEGVKFDASE